MNRAEELVCSVRKEIILVFELKKLNGFKYYDSSYHKIPKIVGIYCIINMITKQIYIGKSTDIASRTHKHYYELGRKLHHNIILQRDVNKYGLENFMCFIAIEYKKYTNTRNSNLYLASLEKMFLIRLEEINYPIYNIGDRDALTKNGAMTRFQEFLKSSYASKQLDSFITYIKSLV